MTDLLIELGQAIAFPLFLVFAVLACCGTTLHQCSLEKQQQQYEQQRVKP
jgi:hypothetical protein